VIAVNDFNIKGGLRFEARPLLAKLWIVAYGNFILRILGLRFDQVFVGAFLNMEFVVGHRRADGIIGWFGQQVYEQPVPGVQVFPLFQNRQAIFQHILDIERPERGRDEHPLDKVAAAIHRHWRNKNARKRARQAQPA
jgi:hypothetical protein